VPRGPYREAAPSPSSPTTLDVLTAFVRQRRPARPTAPRLIVTYDKAALQSDLRGLAIVVIVIVIGFGAGAALLAFVGYL